MLKRSDMRLEMALTIGFVSLFVTILALMFVTTWHVVVGPEWWTADLMDVALLLTLPALACLAGLIALAKSGFAGPPDV